MLVLTGDLVVGEQVGQLLHEVDDLLVPRHIGHGEAAGRALATVGHSLHSKDKTESISAEPRLRKSH